MPVLRICSSGYVKTPFLHRFLAVLKIQLGAQSNRSVAPCNPMLVGIIAVVIGTTDGIRE